jgi:gas vesicle protein
LIKERLPMANLRKLWKGMLWGALAGGAVSLLDKETRLAVKESCQKAAKSITYVVKNPEEITQQVKEKALQFKTTVEEIGEDISYIADKVEELRETTPQVTKMLKETKDTFIKNEEDRKAKEQHESF